MPTVSRNIITLKSKLTLPQIFDTIERPRLNALFKAIKARKLITITAGAGYGKTTVAAQACLMQGMKVVWYRLDSSDNDFVVFIHYLIAGIRQHIKSFGVETLERFTSAEELLKSANSFKIDPRTILTVLLHEMEKTITDDLIIALDDFHLIKDSKEIKIAIDFILNHLPPKLHLIIIGRKPSDIDLYDMIVKREVLVIVEKDLAFTRAEIDDLYRQIFHIDLQGDDLKDIEQRTCGWAAGLILFHYTLKNKDPGTIESRLSFLKGSSEFFDAYIERNIFKTLSPETSAFIVKTSILSRLEVIFCNQLLYIENAGEILQSLEKMHLFTFALDVERSTYHFHHLFRDFLEAKFSREWDKQTRTQLHVQAAQLWKMRNEPNEAIRHFLKADAYESASQLIAKHGSKMVQNGQVNQLLSYLEHIPKNLLEKDPKLNFILGNALMLKGRTKEAIEAFKCARHYFENNRNQDEAGICLMRISILYFLYHGYNEAETISVKFLNHAEPGTEFYFNSIGNLIYIASRLGNVSQADYYFQKAKTIIDIMGEPLNSGIIYLNYAQRFIQSEDFYQVIHFCQKAKKIFIRFNNHIHIPRCYHVISTAWLNLGEYAKSRESALKGIRLCEEHGFMEINYAFCLILAAMATSCLGNFSEALIYCRKSLTVCDYTGNDVAEAWAHHAHSAILFRTHDLEGGEKAARMAVNTIERTSLEQDRSILTIFLARILLERERQDEAVALIESIDKMTLSSKNITRRVDLFHAALSSKVGRINEAKFRLCKVLELKPKTQKDILIVNEFYWIIPLLVELYTDKKYQREIEALLSSFNQNNMETLKKLSKDKKTKTRKAAASLLKAIQKHSHEDLRINCFGIFTLFRGNTEISAQQWLNGKARMLFKYFAFHSQSGYLSKDQLLELLWPDQDPAVTNKRLHVALTTIRKTIEPELKRGERSTYLLRDGDAYKLHLGEKGFLDVAAFDLALAKADKAEEPQEKIKLYLEAESLYKGELFAEEPYIQWCMHEREVYKEKYLAIIKKIAAHYLDAKEPAKCIDYLCRAVQVDEYAEDIYCFLMDSYHQIGNRLMAIKIYEQCRRKLEIDLQCPLSDETRLLYQHILAV